MTKWQAAGGSAKLAYQNANHLIISNVAAITTVKIKAQVNKKKAV
jgi:hypothetical protein